MSSPVLDLDIAGANSTEQDNTMGSGTARRRRSSREAGGAAVDVVPMISSRSTHNDALPPKGIKLQRSVKRRTSRPLILLGAGAGFYYSCSFATVAAYELTEKMQLHNQHKRESLLKQHSKTTAQQGREAAQASTSQKSRKNKMKKEQMLSLSKKKKELQEVVFVQHQQEERKELHRVAQQQQETAPENFSEKAEATADAAEDGCCGIDLDLAAGDDAEISNSEDIESLKDQ
ncbi:unnamed protein product, partial [Amoebophrya sp. A120]|eukprot:GSA120T00007212001.1